MTRADDITLETLGAFPLPGFETETDKNSRGRALVVGGGAWGPGAPLLTGLAALRSGAGKVQIATAERFAPALSVAIPEAAILTVPATSEGEFDAGAGDALAEPAQKADALIIGPGILDDRIGAELAKRLVAATDETRLLIDAGALTALDPESPLPNTEKRLVITPHAGEMASFLSCEKAVVLDAPLAAARDAAQRLGATVVLKGAQTFIVTPDGRALSHRGGVVGLATSGSGDALAGLIGGLLAQGADPLTAAAWGVCVHGAAGCQLTKSVGEVGFLAREILDQTPRLLRRPA